MDQFASGWISGILWIPWFFWDSSGFRDSSWDSSRFFEILLGFFGVSSGFFWSNSNPEILLGFLRILLDSYGSIQFLGFFWVSSGILLGFFWDSSGILQDSSGFLWINSVPGILGVSLRIFWIFIRNLRDSFWDSLRFFWILLDSLRIFGILSHSSRFSGTHSRILFRLFWDSSRFFWDSSRFSDR